MFSAPVRSFVILLSGIIALSFASCSTEGPGGLNQLEFSRDTVFFDTVFTQMGSSTEMLIVRNTGNSPITISNIAIPSGNNSVFRMNVNGYPGNSIDEIEIDAHDSVYVFLEVTLDPNGGTTPLIYEDSVVFSLNGNTRNVQLAVPGQDAIYYYPTDTLFFSDGSILPYSNLPCNTVWKPGKPIVVVGWAFLPQGCNLTVEAGTQVYMYKDAGLRIRQNATLKVLGELDRPVVFQGTRLNYLYANVPGQWDRINIEDGSTGNIIRNAVIKNGFIGLQCDNLRALPPTNTPGTPTGLELENVVIKNMSGLGMFSRNFDITGFNVLVSNCGQYGVAFTYGGNVKFYHSTFVNYWNSSNRNFPTLFFSNYYFDGQNLLTYALNFEFNNGILYGNVENELDFDSSGVTVFNYKFDHSLIRIDPDVPTTDPAHFTDIQKNEEPMFVNSYQGDFRLLENSPAINIGSITFVQQNLSRLMFDLKGSNRTVSGKPDAGAYEK